MTRRMSSSHRPSFPRGILPRAGTSGRGFGSGPFHRLRDQAGRQSCHPLLPLLGLGLIANAMWGRT